MIRNSRRVSVGIELLNSCSTPAQRGHVCSNQALAYHDRAGFVEMHGSCICRLPIWDRGLSEGGPGDFPRPPLPLWSASQRASQRISGLCK